MYGRASKADSNGKYLQVCCDNGAVDCNGICEGSSAIDCNGVCGGTASYDQCNICSGGNTGIPSSSSGQSCMPTLSISPKAVINASVSFVPTDLQGLFPSNMSGVSFYNVTVIK